MELLIWADTHACSLALKRCPFSWILLLWRMYLCSDLSEWKFRHPYRNWDYPSGTPLPLGAHPYYIASCIAHKLKIVWFWLTRWPAKHTSILNKSTKWNLTPFSSVFGEQAWEINFSQSSRTGSSIMNEHFTHFDFVAAAVFIWLNTMDAYIKWCSCNTWTIYNTTYADII